jgi:tetratricopeptide (TPR) repeat protein
MLRIIKCIGLFLLLGLFSCGFVDNEEAREYTKKADSIRHQSSKRREAIELYTKAIEADPDYLPAYEGRGLTRLDMNIPEKGVVQDFNKVIELDPDRIEAFKYRARAHGSQWNQNAANLDWEHYLKFKPKDRITLNHLCFGYNRVGKFKKAVERCTQYLKKEPGYNGLIQRGDAYIFLSQFDKALKDFNQALSNNSDGGIKAIVLFRRAKAYCGLGKSKLCLQDLEQSLKLQPNKMVSYYRGFVYFYLKEYEKAGNDFNVLLAENRERHFITNTYPALWMYLVDKILKRDTPKLIEELKAMSFDSSWPSPIFSLFEEEITPEELLKHAVDKDDRNANRKKGEAYFYIGQHFLSKGNKAEANKWFQKLFDAQIGMRLNEINTAQLAMALT